MVVMKRPALGLGDPSLLSGSEVKEVPSTEWPSADWPRHSAPNIAQSGSILRPPLSLPTRSL